MMEEKPKPIRVQEIDWSATFTWLKLAGAFRLAVHPPKLFLCLMLVLLLYLGGWVLDASLPGRSVYPGELNRYATMSAESFRFWVEGQSQAVKGRMYGELSGIRGIGGLGLRPDLETREPVREVVKAINEHYSSEYQRLVTMDPALEKDELDRRVTSLQKQRADRLQSVRLMRPRGPFAAALEAQISGFEKLIRAAIALDFGVKELLSDSPAPSNTVVGALRQMLVTVPAWMWAEHRFFLILYLIYGLGLWAILGGAVARMNALHACRDVRLSPSKAVAFAGRRWVWLVGTPMLPLVLSFVLGLVLTLSGFIFYNWPVLDVVGSLLFGLSLVLGVVIAVLLVGWLLSVSLFYPALAVEGTDAFDAVSRCYNYVLGRPWRWLFYNVLALVYGAVCYVFVATLVFVTLWVTRFFIGVGVFREADLGVGRFEAILPMPRFGALAYNTDLWLLGITGKVSAIVISIWVYALVGLLAAFAISYFLAANTWVYLLLRRSADGTEFDEINLDAAKADVNDTAKAAPKEDPSAA